MKPLHILFLSGLLFAACGKVDVEPGPQGPAGPQGPPGVPPAGDTALLYGNVSLYNEFTSRMPRFDSVLVTLHFGKDSLQTLTDTLGNYQFPHLETGTYNITYARPGFGTMKVFGHSHFGGGQQPDRVDNIVLMQRPVLTQARNLVMGIDSTRYATTFYLFFDLGFNANDYLFEFGGRNMEIYLSNKPHPGPDNYLVSTSATQLYSNYTYYVYYNVAVLDPYLARGDSIYASVTTFTRYRYTPVPGIPGYGSWNTTIDGLSYLDPANAQTVWPAKGDPVYGQGVYTYRHPPQSRVSLKRE